jgi:hypothetical protein
VLSCVQCPRCLLAVQLPPEIRDQALLYHQNLDADYASSIIRALIQRERDPSVEEEAGYEPPSPGPAYKTVIEAGDGAGGTRANSLRMSATLLSPPQNRLARSSTNQSITLTTSPLRHSVEGVANVARGDSMSPPRVSYPNSPTLVVSPPQLAFPRMPSTSSTVHAAAETPLLSSTPVLPPQFSQVEPYLQSTSPRSASPSTASLRRKISITRKKPSMKQEAAPLSDDFGTLV